jgi:photosystem II stability/assembly factor-like uncharacterized protein
MMPRKQSWRLFWLCLAFVGFLYSGSTQSKQWVSVGPTPIQSPDGIYFGTGNVTGRIADVVVDPDDSDHWLIGGAFGGVWETRDAGNVWIPRSDDAPTQAMGAIAFSPSDPMIVYAGTGEAVWFVGAGLLKSTDGGMTWQLQNDMFANTSFSDILVDPLNPDHLIAATTWAKGPSHTSGLLGEPLAPKTGIYRSIDGGQNWLLILEGRATDLEAEPGNFNHQYVGLGNQFGHVDNGVYRSTDAGLTWNLVDGPWSTELGGVGRVELALAPSNPNVLYVAVHDATDGTARDNQLLGIWRSENIQDTNPVWTELAATPTFGAQTHYDLDVIVDPIDADILYAGGVELYRWTNLAVPEWINIRGGSCGIHVDVHSMTTGGGRLIVGNDGGLYSISLAAARTINSGCHQWANHNTNLSLTQFYYGSVHPDDPNVVMGGSQDNGTERRIVNNSWEREYGGDGMDNVFSSSNPDTDWAISFQSTGAVQNILKTINAGVTFRSARINTADTPEYHTRFEKCPNDDNTFIASSASRLWLTNDFFDTTGPTWLDNNSPPIIRKPGIGDGTSALAFAPSDASCETYAFGNNHSQVFLTTDGGNSWNSIIDPASHVCCIEDLAFQPDNSSIIYATVGGYPNHKLIKTSNAMDPTPTWIDITPTGMSTGPFSLLVDPRHTRHVYMGGFDGVWHSTNGGATWVQTGPESGLPHVAVTDLEANTLGNIYAFTFGRGAYKLAATRDVRYLIGDRDGFHSGDAVDVPPQSQLVLDLIASRAPEDDDVDLDVGGVNRPVGMTHNFTMPANAELTSAYVEFTFRGSEHVHNDGILYQDPAYPLILFQDLLGFEPQDNVSYTLTVDLSNVPVRTGGVTVPGGYYTGGPDDYRNLLPELADGQFDMVFIDDVVIDYSELTIQYVLSLEGDLNADNCVDRTDLRLILADMRGRSNIDASYDLNGDNVFNIADVRYLVTLFTNPRGAPCP